MSRAAPVVELVLEENEFLSFIHNKDRASKRNPTELKQNLKFPLELLLLFEDGEGN